MKYKYSVDSKNQLLIKPPRNKSGMPAAGRFSVNKENRLIYRLNEPEAWRRRYSMQEKVVFTGNWKLNANYDLQLNLNGTKSQYAGDRLILKGEIISSDRDALVFEIISQDKEGNSHIQLLKITGSWQADEFNRITFTVKKKPSPDVMTLEGAWQVNKSQQVTYTYEKTLLKRKIKVNRFLTFEGYWEIRAGSRLTYILLHSAKSRFDFRVQIESPNLYPSEGVVKYRIGIGLKEDKPYRMRVISLYGSWKFSRKAGLNFRVDYGNGRFKDIEFGANIYMSKKDETSFTLTDKEREPLGLNIIFNHKFLKNRDAQAFLRLKDILDKKEAAVEAGAHIPF